MWCAVRLQEWKPTVFYIFSIVFPAVVCFLSSDTNSLVSPLKLCKINSLLLWFDICKFALNVIPTVAGEGSVRKKRVLIFHVLELLYVQYKLRQSEQLLLKAGHFCNHVMSKSSENIYLCFSK